MAEFERLLPIVVRVGAAVGAFLLLSIALALIEFRLLTVLRAIRRLSARVAAGKNQRAREAWARFASYWGTRQREFSHPTIIELSRLRRATGGVWRPAMRAFERKLDRATQRLRSFAGADQPRSVQTEIRAPKESTSWFVFTIALVALLGMSAANFWLLRLFFQEQTDEALSFFGIGQHLTGADMLAFLFPLVEFSAGVVLHVLQIQPGVRVLPAKRFMGTVAPWTILAALAIVELFAYAMLASNFELDQRFGLTENHPFYLVARYFMAPFGVALTLGIAGLGYYVIDAWEISRAPRVLAKIHRQVTGALQAITGLRDHAGEFPKAVETRIGEAEEMLDRKLRTINGGTPGSSTLGELISSYAEALLVPVSKPSPVPGALGQLGLFLVYGGAWILLLWLNSRQFRLVAQPVDSVLAKDAIGYSLAGLVTALGYALGQTDYQRRDSQQALLEGHTLPVWLVYAAVAGAVGLSIGLSIVHRTVTDTMLINSLHGFILPVGLLFASLQLPIVMQAFGILALFVLTVGRTLLQLLAVVLAIGVEVASMIVSYAIRFLAVPGARVIGRLPR